MKTQVVIDGDKIRVDLANGSSDYPIQYFDGRIAYNFPERVPQFAKNKVAQLFYRKHLANPSKNKADVLKIFNNKGYITKEVPTFRPSKGDILWAVEVENFHGFVLHICEYISYEYRSIDQDLYTKNGEHIIGLSNVDLNSISQDLQYLVDNVQEKSS